MRPWKTWLLAFCLFSMLGQQVVYANAALAPVENFVVNRAIAGVVANRIAAAEGMAANDALWLAKAANDPVFKATMEGISSQMTAANVVSTVAGGALAIAGAPVWMTIAASLAITAGAAWYFTSNAPMPIPGPAPSVNQSMVKVSANGKVEVTPKPADLPMPYVPPKPVQVSVIDPWMTFANSGGLVFRNFMCHASDGDCNAYPVMPPGITISNFVFQAAGRQGQDVVVNNLDDAARFTKLYFQYQEQQAINQMGTPHVDGYPRTLVSFSIEKPTMTGQNPRVMQTVQVTHWSQAGGAWTSSVSTITEPSIWFPNPQLLPQKFDNLNDAYNNMDPSSKGLPMQAQQLADLANAAWRKAASDPNYQGLPYSATNPLTAQDVASWQAAHPGQMPTLGDLLAPATNPSFPGVPISPVVYPGPVPDPGPGPGPQPIPGQSQNVNVMNSPRIDMGPDPNTPAPTLEDTPTADIILKPLTSLFPELRGFQTPGHASQCPKPVFDVFGKSIVMDQHCTLMEQHRQALAAAMLVVWLLVGLFILLSA